MQTNLVLVGACAVGCPPEEYIGDTGARQYRQMEATEADCGVSRAIVSWEEH